MTTSTITINSGKKKIESESGICLIDALANQGIYLPSACGSTGRCGLCKVVVKQGGNAFSPQELTLLSKVERDASVRLGCQVRVSDGMDIELSPEFLNAQDFVAILRKKKFLTRDIVELTLELTSSMAISFHAGQYITLKMPAYQEKKAAMRPFSIASSNSDKTCIQLNVRLNPIGTVTPWIFNMLQEGQEVRFSGPRGSFFVQNSLNPMVFVAGGSGMAPVRSILRTLKDHQSNRNALFFFGAVTQNDLFYLDEMRVLEKELVNFSFIPALSNEPDSSDWQGERGLITEVIDRIMVGDMSKHEAYLCGKPAMIEGCLPILNKKGIHSDRIFFDLFNSPKPIN